MFGIRNLSGLPKVSYETRPIAGYCHIIEGVAVMDTLCPVSKLTGYRENPLLLLSRVLDPAKARLVDSVLQQIPSMTPEGSKISDSDALDMIMDRLATGTPAEDALMRNRLSDMLDVLIPANVRSEVEQTIQFDQADALSAESESK